VTFTLGGVKCGLMICYDSNYLQMFNAYAHQGVELLFYSSGHAGFKSDHAKIDQATIHSYTINYRMWIAVGNSSSRYSGLISCLGDPNGMGRIAKTLKRHVAGVFYHDFTSSSFKNYWNTEVKLAKLHPREIFHNGKPSRHPRALNRRSLP
jgi:predicted amidohydrolase